ncbi:hypothetical protein BLD44_000865 [Mastigocladus laminosus UU774]|nr:hypothetical protein BLD44_000865 [Mastigocladus laminosus UU774]
MSKTKFLRLLTIGTFFTALYLGINTSPASSQRSSTDNSASLYKGATCTTSKSSGRIKTDSTNVSVSRQLYTSSMSMYTARNKFIMLTCKADPNKFSTLKLQMGVSDDDSKQLSLMTVNIYQGGNLQHTYKDIGPGKLINTVLDLQNRNITKPENIAIELLCEKANPYCTVYFFEAQLLPSSNSNYIAPKSSKSSIKTSQLGLHITRK